MESIRFAPLFVLEVQTSPQWVGQVPLGYVRRAGIIREGTFRGERLSGTVLPGGGDFLMKRQDGVIHLDVRTILETDAGETIYLTYTGRRKAPADVDERLARGETIPAQAMYFRTAVQFETAASSVSWLNDVVAFGIGHSRPIGPVYDIYELL